MSEADLQRRVRELGDQITADYAGRPPLLVGVLKGACFFLSDLARAIDLPVEIDFMAVSSYGSATHTSGVVRILKDLDLDLTGRHVLIVEDIVDSGLTLSYLRRNLAARHPASLQVVALLVKDGLSPWTSIWPTRGSASRPSSSSATGSTPPSATATCRSSPCTEASPASRGPGLPWALHEEGPPQPDRVRGAGRGRRLCCSSASCARARAGRR